ncbi:MAG: DUF4215 domain-containing protein, partial [Myxococcota bacterium]|nr:DUF4215 domain-containing protein [Myxococcota bacterium]
MRCFILLLICALLGTAACRSGFLFRGFQCDSHSDCEILSRWPDLEKGMCVAGHCVDPLKHNVCGDGFILAGEEVCDDGNQSNEDACLNTCVVNVCGDGFIFAGEEVCDDGNQSNEDACLNACVVNVCGDGFIFAEEEACDDGNTTTEACDYGETSCSVCNYQCQSVAGETSYCNNGIVESNAGEACDDAGSTPTHGTCVNCAVICSAGYPAQVEQIVTGRGKRSCARLDDGRLKCWGINSLGSLGLGDTEDRGDEAGEMGTSLPALDLGINRTVLAV